MAIIVLAGVLVGLQTYESLNEDYGDIFHIMDAVSRFRSLFCNTQLQVHPHAQKSEQSLRKSHVHRSPIVPAFNVNVVGRCCTDHCVDLPHRVCHEGKT